MTETLPASPSPDVNITRKRKPNVKVAQFGDGYSQRASFGLNQVKLEATLTYTNLVTEAKDIINDFAEAHDRGEAFYWQMPDEDAPRSWYLVGWDVTYLGYNHYTVILNIEECFDIL